MHLFKNSTEALGWALLHFLWQGAAVALLLGLGLRALRQRSAQARYALACLALLLMLGVFLGTLVVVWERPVAVVAPVNKSYESHTAYEEPVLQPTVMAEAAPLVISQPPLMAAAPVAEAAQLPAPAPVPFSEKVRPYLPWAVGIWAAGVVCFALRFLLALLAVRGWKRSGQDIVSAEWKQRFSHLRAALEVSRTVQFLSSAAIVVPMVIGWLKPVVLVPAGLFAGLTTAQLEAILAHELAHIRRHDYLANLFQHFMETLFFYHPAVWWISSKMREEREHCCDDLAASACGGALGYAKALTALEELRGSVPVLSVSASGGSLLARIRRILGLPEEKSRAWPLGLLAVLALAIIPFALAKEERGTGVPPVSPDPAVASEAAPAVQPATQHDSSVLGADGRDAHDTSAEQLAQTTTDGLNLSVAENLTLLSPKVQPKSSSWLEDEANEALMELISDKPRGFDWVKSQESDTHKSYPTDGFFYYDDKTKPFRRQLSDADDLIGDAEGLLGRVSEPTKTQPSPTTNLPPDPASAKADERDAHATVTFAEHCEIVAAGKGVTNRLDLITTWGQEQQGLQAGLVILGKAIWGKPCAGWIVVRNTSSTEVREFMFCPTTDAVHLLAEDGQGNALTCRDGIGELTGKEALIPKKLGPGESLEFPINAVVFSQFEDIPGPSVHVIESQRTCRFWLDLDQMIRLKVPMKSFTTGKVLMNMVHEATDEIHKRETAQQTREQAKAVPKVELMSAPEGNLLIIKRGGQQVRIFSSEPMKHTLNADTQPKQENWRLHGDILLHEKDGREIKLPLLWASHAPDAFALSDQSFQLQGQVLRFSNAIHAAATSQEVASSRAFPFPFGSELFFRIQPDGKVEELSALDKIPLENDVHLIKQRLVVLESMALKYKLSRALSHELHGTIEWVEEQADGEKMLKLKIAADGKIQYLPTPDKIIERKLDKAKILALREWLEGRKQDYTEDNRVANDSFGRVLSFPLFPSGSHFSLIENSKNISTTYRHWSAKTKGKNGGYEQIKARILAFVE